MINELRMIVSTDDIANISRRDGATYVPSFTAWPGVDDRRLLLLGRELIEDMISILSAGAFFCFSVVIELGHRVVRFHIC